MIIQKTQEYLDYIKEHRDNVRKAWEEINIKCKDFSFIYDDWQYKLLCSLIENHDDSKLSHEEFVPYREKFFPCPHDTRKEFEEEFDLAWEHHKKNNPHHWEYWQNNKPHTPYGESLYAVEMVCDWMAMGYKFGDTAEQFYLNNKHKITLQVPEEFIFQIFEALKK